MLRSVIYILLNQRRAMSWQKKPVHLCLDLLNCRLAFFVLGIPEAAEVAMPVAHLPANQATSEGAETRAVAVAPISGAPNSSPLNLFPQETISGGDGSGGLGPLDFLRNSQQFQALRSMVQANPQILQLMLQELGKQNPQLLRLIQEHNA